MSINIKIILYLFCISNIYTKEDKTTININKESTYEDPLKNYTFTNVIHLDGSNFTTELAKYESIFLIIYGPSCIQCHQFVPIFIEVADYCKQNNLDIKFAKIDGNKNMNITLDFKVKYFPGIYFIYKGKRQYFTGIKTKEGILYFMKRKMSYDIFKINKLKELANIKNVYNTSLILLSTIRKSNFNSTLYQSFNKSANELMYVDFVSCLSEECYNKYGEDIILFKNFDEKENRYLKDYSNGKLEETMDINFLDFFSKFAVEMGAYATQHEINIAFDFRKKTIYYIRNSSNEEETKYDYLFKQLGKELRNEDTYAFVCSPKGNEIQDLISKTFNIIPEDLPGIFYYDAQFPDRYFPIQLFSLRHVDMKSITIQSIKDFIKDIYDGKIKRDLLTEAKPEKEYINGMKYVIGKTYDEEIMEEKNNNIFLGLIEGFGDKKEKNFLEVFGNLSQKYLNDTEKKLKFKIMDINKNEPRNIAMNGFDFPRAYLMTNAMSKKKQFRFKQKNRTADFNREEFEEFIKEKLNETYLNTNREDRRKRRNVKENKERKIEDL